MDSTDKATQPHTVMQTRVLMIGSQCSAPLQSAHTAVTNSRAHWNDWNESVKSDKSSGLREVQTAQDVASHTS